LMFSISFGVFAFNSQVPWTFRENLLYVSDAKNRITKCFFRPARATFSELYEMPNLKVGCKQPRAVTGTSHHN
jgi:hypothetical protein